MILETQLRNSIKFSNRSLQQLPFDARSNEIRPSVSGFIYSKPPSFRPTRVASPNVILTSPTAFSLLNVAVPYAGELTPSEHSFLSDIFSGNELLEGMEPAAHCYCGHLTAVQRKRYSHSHFLC